MRQGDKLRTNLDHFSNSRALAHIHPAATAARTNRANESIIGAVASDQDIRAKKG